jgi:hypothetical protein
MRRVAWLTSARDTHPNVKFVVVATFSSLSHAMLHRTVETLVLLALIGSYAGDAGAQAMCGGPVTRASPGQSTMRGPSTGNPLEALRRACARQVGPSFLSEDSTALLAGIRLTRMQRDSVDKAALPLRNREAQLILATYQRNQPALDSAGSDKSAAAKTRVRAIYLTPEMDALRSQHMLVLRRYLTPEQVSVFDSNLVALKQREGQAG